MIRTLSIFALYRCRRTGACCTAGWPIPIEADRLARVRAAVASRTLVLPRDPRGELGDPTRAAEARTPDDDCVIRVDHEGCVFYDTAQHACVIQTSLGHDALPLACRQFPRVSVVDPRSVSVTLSAYCPSVAAAFAAPGPLAVVSGATAFPADGEYVGLDAREALPPLLRPDLLMDWDAWHVWESRAVDLIAGAASAGEALARLSVAVEDVRGWSPGADPLTARVEAAVARASATAVYRPRLDREAALRFAGEVDAAIPPELRPKAPIGGAARAESAIDRAARPFLAAHAFGSWTAHLGRGLRTWLRSVEAAYALLCCGLDVQQADLRLRHLADPRALAKLWGTAEDED